MKKLFTFCALAASCLLAHAQYSVGDLIEKDEVKAVVIRVDETGEHGLMMSLTGPYMLQKFYDEALAAAGDLPDDPKAKKKVLSKVSNSSAKDFKAYIKTHFVKLAPHYRALSTQLDGDGRHNAEVIREYCRNNNLDLQEMFPAQYWAENLGEGWFIPGDNELEDWSYVIGNGLGKKLYKGGIVVSPKFYKPFNDLKKEIYSREGFQSAVLPMKIWSSSVSMGKKEVDRNCFRDNSANTQFSEHYWYELAPLPDDFFISGTAADCAVCEF